MKYTLSSADISIFQQHFALAILGKKINNVFWYIICDSSVFSWTLKGLIDVIAILMMSAELANPGLLEINVFEIKVTTS